jgi:2-oxoglutarate dehydrogenase E2 component (dihydrolipoamide succinyltransferase)
MPINIIIPEMGESVAQGVIQQWRKRDGDFVKRDEALLDLETDKVTAEVPAPASGVLRISKNAGETVPVKSIVGTIDETASATLPATQVSPSSTPAASKPEQGPTNGPATNGTSGGHAGESDVRSTPLARKLADERGVDLASVHGTGPGGRVREQDVLAAASSRSVPPAATASAAATPRPVAVAVASTPPSVTGSRGVRREKMSQLRQRIASRLVEAQHTAAMLTTFNECDLSAVMAMRSQHKDAFEKKHGVGLGFMSFFVKAVVNGLKAFPAVNASIVTDEKSGEMGIEYHDYCDIAIAVGTPKGLTVPVLRGCEHLGFAQIESGVKELATKAKDGKLTLAELQGGTFTITNGGIYGSLMSTPILNPPQCGILGMHAIKPRAIEYPVGSGQVAIRPMMYLALSYDHRLIDGSEAVQFLVAVKNGIEQPERLLLGM